MTVEDTGKIDVIKRIAGDGQLVLEIEDPLSWGSERHLFLLQEKVNTYVSFVETGQYLEHVDAQAGDQIRIEVVATHPPDATGQAFLFEIGERMARLGHALTYRIKA